MAVAEPIPRTDGGLAGLSSYTYACADWLGQAILWKVQHGRID